MKMKKIIICLMAALMGFSAMAQERRVEIYKGGKVVFSDAVANIDSIIVDCSYQGHGYVDLGLPSGTMWATSNVGANSPTAIGGYFAWGEIATKTSYTQENSLTHGKGFEEYENFSGNAQYDVARAQWGGEWRMPTREEFQELIDNCTWVKKMAPGSREVLWGYTVTGPNGNSIYFPVTGYHVNNEYRDAEMVWSWSSTSCVDYVFAYTLSLDAERKNLNSEMRLYGMTVRPVFTPQPEQTEYPYVDLGLPSGVKWSTMNIGQTDGFRSGGDYFAWGEIATKKTYSRDNSLTLNNNDLTEISGNPQYDAARAIWGGSWRMPTLADVEELMSECTWELNRFNITGRGEIIFYTVTGPNGKSINILVSGGYYSDVTLTNQEEGYFWISTTSSGNARYFRVKTDGKEPVWTGHHIGVPIRPVMD